MVASLPMPEEDSLTVFDRVYAERTRLTAFYTAIHDDWRSQVELYIEHRGDPRQVQPLNIASYVEQDLFDRYEAQQQSRGGNTHPVEQRKKTLINLYEADRGKEPYAVLHEMRKENGLLFCPSCGEDGSPGTLDHYLPKDIYPELSIVVANLTPMCPECQREKGTRYINDDGEKIYIHPYFDRIDRPILELEIIGPFEAPQDFILRPVEGEDEVIVGLVGRHIEGINLYERFQRFCEEDYMHILKLISDEREEEDPLTTSRLLSRFLRKEELKAVNCWKAIMYRSVLSNQALLDYLDHEDLPRFL